MGHKKPILRVHMIMTVNGSYAGGMGESKEGGVRGQSMGGGGAGERPLSQLSPIFSRKN